MERRGRMPETIERSPLIDPQNLRSCRSRSTPASRSLGSRPAGLDSSRGSSTKHSLKPISELQQPNHAPLERSQSAPHHSARSATAGAGPQYLLRSPQYRVNPVVKFDDCLVPKRMNYGIAGYNTSRPRSGSFSLHPEKNVPGNKTPRPKSFSGVPGNHTGSTKSFSGIPGNHTTRPRSVSSIPESRPRSIQTHHRTRAVIWRSFTRRVCDKMGRIRVRDTCSKLLSRFRR